MLVRLARGIERVARPITGYMSTLGAFALLLLMLWTVADVVLRFLFNRPILGTYEVVEYSLVAFVFMAFAYAQFCKAHIRVPVLLEKLGPRGRSLLEAISSVIVLAMGVVMTWGALLQSINQYNSHVTSAVLLIPKWPFEVISFIGLFAFCVAMLVDVLADISMAMSGGVGDEQKAEDLRTI